MERKRKIIILAIYSFCFAIIDTLCVKKYSRSYLKGLVGGTNTINIIIYFIIILLVVFAISYLIFYLLEKIRNIKPKEIKNRFLIFYDKNTFVVSFIFLLIAWLPIIIIKYPGVINYDAGNQIAQFFGMITLKNHHPVLHTVIMGICVKLGWSIHDFNFGIFIFTMLQTIVLAGTLSYTIKYLKKLNIHIGYRIALLLVYSFVIIFPVTVTIDTKDVLYTSFAILYTIMYYELINRKKEETSIKNIIFSIIISLLFAIFRKEGLYIVIFSFPILFILNKKNIKKLLIIFIITILSYSAYRTTLNLLKIPNGSIKEALALPFQQTATYINEYPDEVTEEEKEIIDKLLNYSTIQERFDIKNVDPIKAEYNNKATKEDLLKYFQVYINQFFKHPKIYFETVRNTTNGYFFFRYKSGLYSDKIKDNYLKYFNDYHYIEQFSGARENISNTLAYMGERVVVIKAGFHFWVIAFLCAYLIYKKEYRDFCYLIPVILIIITCLLFPHFAYRYAIHYVFQVPLLIGIMLNINKKDRKKEVAKNND